MLRTLLVPHQAPCVKAYPALSKWWRCLTLQNASPTDPRIFVASSLASCRKERERISEPPEVVQYHCPCDGFSSSLHGPPMTDRADRMEMPMTHFFTKNGNHLVYGQFSPAPYKSLHFSSFRLL